MNLFTQNIINCPKCCLQSCEYSKDCLAKAGNSTTPTYMTASEAVEFSGLDRGHLYYMANYGRLHLYKIGKRQKRFRKDELEKLLAEIAGRQKKREKKNVRRSANDKLTDRADDLSAGGAK